MNIKQILTACLIGCTTLALATASALAQLFTVIVDDLNVRRGPGINYPVTYVLQRGDRVEVTRRQGDWAFIVGERGGEGWVASRFLSSDTPSPSPSPDPQSTNDVFRSQGTIENARYTGRGEASLVIVRRDNGASFSLTQAGDFSVEYIGTVRSNFEGTVQLQVNQFRSSEIGYRTVAASGTCDIQASTGTVRRAFCTITGAGIDHGRSNFRAQ